ncbi:unnamed protein product [Prunus armeniaca]|uniref:Uncharacterized protein n=1 Tax=Prunus armeniaca TaxID=36596 RepID=A0A6J5WYC5_PRUAR|nr:unnamed protein product [Prunus armeniaca]
MHCRAGLGCAGRAALGGSGCQVGSAYLIAIFQTSSIFAEEPAGADLIFDQGDNVTGKISREQAAQICVAALESPYMHLARHLRLQPDLYPLIVKSVVPFSEPFTVDPQNPSPEKDYNVYFKTLKDGITGKEILEQDPVPV